MQHASTFEHMIDSAACKLVNAITERARAHRIEI